MILLLVLAAAFGLIAWQVQTQGPVVMLDGLVQAALAPLRTRPVLLAFDWLTQAGTGGTGAIVALVASGLLATSGRATLVGPLWIAFVGAEATTWSLKFITGRARPPFLEGLTAGSPSFPSAHATVSVAIYGFLGLAIARGVPPEWRGAVLAGVVALVVLICASRMVLSLHYLSDVLAGAVIGGFWLFVAWRMI